MKKQTTFTLILIFLISAVFLFSLGSPAIAAPSSQQEYSIRSEVSIGNYECTPFDILFLIDQSASMTSNDPNDQRIAAVKWAIRNIGYQSFRTCTNEPMFRLGVVPFGGELDDDFINFTNIKLTNDQELIDLLDNLSPSVKSKNLQNTDFALAFAKASDMFNHLAYSTSTDSKKAVVVITDGTACSIEMKERRECDTPEAIRSYMAKLEGQLLRDFPPEEFYLYIVGINQYDSYSARAQSFFADNAIKPWMRIAGNYLEGSEYVQLGVRSSDIPVVFTEIIEELTGIEGIDISCGDFPVDPYLESVQFNIFRNTDESPVTITVPNNSGGKNVFKGGQEISGAPLFVDPLPIYSTDGVLNETYTFLNPVPGMWGVTMDDFNACEELKGKVIPIYATSRKVAPLQGLPQYPDDDAEFDIEDPYYLQYKIVDRMNNKLPSYGGDFNITANILITSPSGIEYSRQLIYDNTEDLWQTGEALPTNELGVYTYSFLGTVPGIEAGETLTIIEDEDTYEVSQPVERFSWHIDKGSFQSPSPTKSGFGCWTTPNDLLLDVYVTEYGASETLTNELTPIDSTPIFASEDVFTIEIKDSANAVVDTLPVRYIGSEADLGHYQVNISGAMLDKPDTYQVKVNRMVDINAGWGERITEGEHDVLIIKRSETFMTSEKGCTVSIIILILFGAILLGFLIYWITGKPKGFLHFIGPDNGQILQVPVTGTWRKTVLGKNRLGSIRSYVDLTKIIIWREGSAKEHDSKEYGKPSIKITIHGIEDGEKVTFAENEVINDRGEVSLANGCSIIYTRKGVIG